TSTFSIRRTRTSTPGRTSKFPVTYTLKEFLKEYERRAKEASARMEKFINTIFDNAS
ncbi:9996_t:CDS:2, partial [Funneliformis mosseae]